MFVENMTNGRGFMGVAAMYFGGVNPIFAYIGTLIFWTCRFYRSKITITWISFRYYTYGSIYLQQ